MNGPGKEKRALESGGGGGGPRQQSGTLGGRKDPVQSADEFSRGVKGLSRG